MKSKGLHFLVGIFLTLFSSTSNAVVRYVNLSAPGTGDGLSWENAYKDLQAALTAASSGDEIWVAKGTHRTNSVGDQAATFSLKSGVALYGGFAGGETTKDNRNFTSSRFSGATELSGPNGIPAYHVITADGVDETAIVDGFVITGGRADGTGADRFGGAMRINNASPIIRNCWVIGSASDGGAGAPT